MTTSRSRPSLAAPDALGAQLRRRRIRPYLRNCTFCVHPLTQLRVVLPRLRHIAASVGAPRTPPERAALLPRAPRSRRSAERIRNASDHESIAYLSQRHNALGAQLRRCRIRLVLAEPPSACSPTRPAAGRPSTSRHVAVRRASRYASRSTRLSFHVRASLFTERIRNASDYESIAPISRSAKTAGAQRRRRRIRLVLAELFCLFTHAPAAGRPSTVRHVAASVGASRTCSRSARLSSHVRASLFTERLRNASDHESIAPISRSATTRSRQRRRRRIRLVLELKLLRTHAPSCGSSFHV